MAGLCVTNGTVMSLSSAVERHFRVASEIKFKTNTQSGIATF